MNIEKNVMEELLCLLDKKGYIFPGYELLKKNNELYLLGKGGFSSVYEMKSKERVENRYVLKVVGFEKHTVTSDDFRNTVRLQNSLCEQTPFVCRLIAAREIRVLLDEDGVLQGVTEEVGERWTEDGIHLQFILMEKLEDILIKNRFGTVSLARKELEKREEIISFAFQIGQALHQAHINGILHRDVKLENVFWDEVNHCYKLGDFGIAKYAEGGTAETVVYTDGYGAPEIERQLFDSYGATADIYSFGITLYLLLNDLKFPGSEGYYVNMVQYNPEFVFPAPAHASENMTRIIRKMCQFYQDDRYQSMAEVLADLSILHSIEIKLDDKETIELPELETETYREEKVAKHLSSVVRRRELTGREKRKNDEKINNEIYRETSILHFIGFSVLLTLLLKSFRVEVCVIYDWQFWLLVAMVLVEAVLLRIKEVHMLFGVITFGVGLHCCIVGDITVAHVVLMLGLFVSIPVFTGACAVSVILWAGLILSQKMQWLDFLYQYDLSWMLLIIIFFMLNRYVMLRIELDKSTYVRANVELFIIDKIYLVMAGVGMLLLLLGRYNVINVNEAIQRTHMVRTGLISFAIYVSYMYICGYFDVDTEEKEAQKYENELDENRNREYLDSVK